MADALKPGILSKLDRGEAGSSRQTGDIELMSIPSVVGREAGEKDPLLLRSRLMSEGDLDGLKQYVRCNGQETCQLTVYSRKKGKKLASFYESQNEQIQSLLKPLAAHTEDGAQMAKENALKVKIAVNVSLAANVILAIVQLYAAISSLSLALFASCIDAGG